MVSLQGRVLKAPEMEYGDKQICRPTKGAWDMGRGGYQFKKTVKLENWAIINFDERTNSRTLKEFVYNMQDVAANAGFDIENPKKALTNNRPQDVSLLGCRQKSKIFSASSNDQQFVEWCARYATHFDPCSG